MSNDTEPGFAYATATGFSKLADLSKAQRLVFLKLLQSVKRGNKVLINSEIKKAISTEFDIKESTVNQAIRVLIKTELLIKKDTGVYYINKLYFKKGS